MKVYMCGKSQVTPSPLHWILQYITVMMNVVLFQIV